MNDVFLLLPDGDGLKARALKATPTTADWLKAHREELLFLYRERAAIREMDGGLSRDTAQDAAALDVTEQARRMINVEVKATP